jgi:CarD family transcriptional regulator
MFKTGDAVIHPANGAGTVVGLVRMPIQQNSCQFYKIEILDNRKTTLMVPVDAAEKLGLRLAVTRIELDEIWKILSAQPEILPDDHKQRYKVLENKLKTQETTKLAEIVRDLEWRRLQVERLNSPGKRMYAKALSMLAGEVAVAQGEEMEAAQVHIETILGLSLSGYQESRQL